ncbi:hypothetical protein Q3G72_034114 [Acer saccharum]|nr:hypothetical protein Q3G72_034114 [Acer saccharum]
MADAALALKQVLSSVETLEVDENTKQEDASGDGVQVTCFTDLVDDVTFHFQIIRLANQIYAWIGCNSSKLGRLYAAAPTRPSNSVSVSSILGGVSDNTGAGIARRLVLKTGLNVIVACNIPKNSPMLEANAEKKLVEKLISLGLFAFDALHANKADWGDLFTYNSVENFVAMASFVDEQDGVVRFISDAPPTHYKLKIQLFSLLVKNAVEKYDSAEFEAGGYKWKIRLYPNGLKHLNGSHLSLFLLLADFTPDSKVYIDYTLRIMDQLQANHIAVKADHCFTASATSRGLQKFVTPSYLNDPSNGCLVKDMCLVEAEVNVWGCQGSTTDIVM